jgi:hypothetical protein
MLAALCSDLSALKILHKCTLACLSSKLLAAQSAEFAAARAGAYRGGGKYTQLGVVRKTVNTMDRLGLSPPLGERSWTGKYAKVKFHRKPSKQLPK